MLFTIPEWDRGEQQRYQLPWDMFNPSLNHYTTRKWIWFCYTYIDVVKYTYSLWWDSQYIQNHTPVLEGLRAKQLDYCFNKEVWKSICCPLRVLFCWTKRISWEIMGDYGLVSIVSPCDVVLDLTAAAIPEFYNSLDPKAETCSALALENAFWSSNLVMNLLSVPGLQGLVSCLLCYGNRKDASEFC